jgi:hypothetical protein
MKTIDNDDLVTFYAAPERANEQSDSEYFEELKNHYRRMAKKQEKTQLDSERLVNNIYSERNNVFKNATEEEK